MAIAKALASNVISKSKSTIGLVSEFVRTNPVVSGGAVALGGTALATGLVVAAKSRAKKKTSKSKTKKTTKKKRKKVKQTKRRKYTKGGRRIRRTPHTAGKRKDRSTKRIRYTKNGQPYVLTRSGKAKFIKKSSAKRSHKLKGGRY